MRKIAILLFFSSLLFGPLCCDETTLLKEKAKKAVEKYQEGEGKTEGSNFEELWSIVFALVVIIVLMFVGSWFLRRFMQGRMQQANITSTIKILEQRNLSQKSVLYIVEVYDKHLLIAESAAGAFGIAEFPIEEEKSFSELIDKK